MFLADAVADSEGSGKVWRNADLGVSDQSTEKAIETGQNTAPLSTQARHARIGGLSTIFSGTLSHFLKILGLVEETIPEQRRETIFYNLGKFSH